MPQDMRKPVTQGWTLRNVDGTRIVPQPGLTGGTVQGELPPTGFAAFDRLKVVVKFDAPTAATDTFYYGNGVDEINELLLNVKVTNHTGETIIDASAASLYESAKKRRRNYDPKRLPGARALRTSTLAAETTPLGKKIVLDAANNVFVFYIDLPFTPNLGPNALYGIVPVQSNTSKWVIKAQLAALSTVIRSVSGNATFTNVSAYIDHTLYYFDIPSGGDYVLPPASYHYTLTDRLISANMNTGRYQLELAPLDGTIVQAQMQFVSGGSDRSAFKGYVSRGTDFDTQTTNGRVNDLAIWLNTNELHTQIRADEHDARETELYGETFGNGVYTYVDGLTVMDEPGKFLAPDYMWGFVDPSKYASMRIEAGLDNNGQAPAYTKLILHYLKEVAYR
jgi:hypothetical protein